MHNKLDININSGATTLAYKLKLDIAIVEFLTAVYFHPCYVTNLINHMLSCIRNKLNKCYRDKNPHLYSEEGEEKDDIE